MPSIDVTLNGPLFDGELERRIARGVEEARHQVGDRAADQVRARFNRVLRHPTGRLRSQVQVAYEGDRARVTNGNVIYRFWIEGVGSRNRTTRFKGYRTFRLITQLVRREAPAAAARAIARAIRGGV